MDYIQELIARHPALAGVRDEIAEVCGTLERTYKNGCKLLICGNGGSAADADHIVGELMKDFRVHRDLPEHIKEAFLSAGVREGSNSPPSEDARFLAECLRQALPAIALTQHTALATALQNDAGADLVFAQQVYGYGNEGDAFLGLSTSGNARNVILAAMTAKAQGLCTIAFTGADGGHLAEISDISVKVPETETYKVQELHAPVYHALCLTLEERFFG